VQKPAKPHVDVVERIKGVTSLELQKRCPDGHAVFPLTPCTNMDCDWSINCKEYMNCTFVASEAGEHSLQLIGDWLGVSREGIRLIERRGLRKLREADEQANHGTLCEPIHPAGPNHLGSKDKKP